VKASYVALMAAVLGSALGVAISWANFGHTAPLQQDLVKSADSTSTAGNPKVLVLDRFHHFGSVERDTKVRHEFQFTNMGKAPLTLKPGGTSCSSCTIAEISKSVVAPGETVSVLVEYQTNYYKPQFRQTATILTNDPEHPRIELTITGNLTANFWFVPSTFDFSRVSATETKTVEMTVYSRLSDSVRVVKHELMSSESAAYFDVRAEVIAADQLNEPDAKGGSRVLATLKPGLPLGPIRQTIRLELELTGMSEKPVVETRVEGIIDSDISIIGKGWNADAGKLSIGAIKSAAGAKRELFVLLRGPHRHGVTIKPEKIDPEWLKVTLGEPTDLKSGTVTQIPLTIEIPAGTPPTNHLGSGQGKFAEILLETTHPDVKQIPLRVQFMVEQ
jgi:hypothetical protein